MSITVTIERHLNEIERYFLKWNNKPEYFSMLMFVDASWKKNRFLYYIV